MLKELTMSVICENECGWVIDHLASVSMIYQKTQCYTGVNCLKSEFVTEHLSEAQKLSKENEEIRGNNIEKTKTHSRTDITGLQDLERTSEEAEPVTQSFAFKSDLFAIHHPYMMDTQFEKIQRQLTIDHGLLPAKRRKRKSIHQNLCGENNVKDVSSKLKKALSSLVELARCRGYLMDLLELPPDNNISARSAARIRAGDDSQALLCEQWETSSKCRRKPLALAGNSNACYSGLDVVNRRVENAKQCVVSRMMGELFLVPASCNFMLSSMSYFLHNYQQLAVEGGYDLIVVDPPWQNKSVKRKKSYSVLSEEEISTLPVVELAAPGCVIAMWATNKSRVLQFVSELLPAWNVQHFVTWYWLKVTTCGIPISDMDSTQKQPYEMLVLGRTSTEATGVTPQHLPEDKTVISVPCSLHSKKPPLLDLLSPYLPDSPKCLELFARNLWPGWTSWGNEVLQHQHIDFYMPIAPDDKRHSEHCVEEAVVK